MPTPGHEQLAPHPQARPAGPPSPTPNGLVVRPAVHLKRDGLRVGIRISAAMGELVVARARLTATSEY